MGHELHSEEVIKVPKNLETDLEVLNTDNEPVEEQNWTVKTIV